ncbi:hypothetical protein HXA34_16340 [Salipaludibacillus agaradhaerens]|nr:hypothetical protein [Salipaludibacillus agaradhaerens]MCR6119887.1 hypothetical protein [Salipaludibacillus agaradhaerens]
MSFIIIGLGLQIIFILLITLFNFLRVFVIDNYSVYPIALFELFIGVVSLFCGLYSLIKFKRPLLSVFVILFGLFICFFFIFIYLLPEAGTPPVIPWL